VQTLGEDLVLLSINPRSGRLANATRLRFGLMGSELVRLAASRRVDITGGRIAVLDSGPTGDGELDAALASLARAERPAQPKKWVGAPRRRIVDAYLARLASAGAVRDEPGALLTRWRIVDEARAASLRARLDAIVHGTGPAADTEQAAFVGLASASGLGELLYRGWGNRPVRKRLDQIANGQRTGPALPVTDAALGAGDASQAAAGEAASEAVQAATQAASDAAVRAATQAATNAAVQAATDAAVAAAVHAAHHAAAAHSSSTAGTGHH
jgi:Golgi phosphoprotein 3 (GPP34)